MTVDHEFTNLILADPQDHSQWLVYADWLEEQGQTEAASAWRACQEPIDAYDILFGGPTTERRSGRTTRMLLGVLRECLTNNTRKVVYALNDNHARQLLIELVSLCQKLGIVAHQHQSRRAIVEECVVETRSGNNRTQDVAFKRNIGMQVFTDHAVFDHAVRW